MANNCLVTKLKGTVQNDNIPYYGQLTLINTKPSTSGNLSGFVYNLDSSIKYKVVGDCVFYNSSSLIGPDTPAMPTTGTCVGGYWRIEGIGKVLLYPKYQLTSMTIQTGQEINLEEVYSENFPNGFILRPEWGVNWYINNVRKNLQIGNALGGNRLLYLPFVQDWDFSHITLVEEDGVQNLPMCFNYYTSDPRANYTGDLNNILNINNIEHFVFQDISVLNSCYISNIAAFTPLCKDTCIRLVLAGGGIVGGDLATELAKWTQLTDLNTGATSIEWAPVFNAWKAAGVQNRSVIFWCGGTVNGGPIPGHTLVFDTQGNWSFS